MGYYRVHMVGRFAPGARQLALAALLIVAVVSLACSGERSPLGQGGSAEKPRVLIVHSYDNGFRWSAKQEEGIREGLKRGGYEEGSYDLRVFYMDTRVNFLTREQIALRAEIALRTIEEFAPQLVFLTDDIAVEEVALPYLRNNPDSPVSFVFSGVNGDPSRYAPVRSLDAPGVRLTGTVERIPFQEAFAAARRVFGSSTHVVVFADDSPSSRTVMDGLRRSLAEDSSGYPLKVVDVVVISTFEEWKEKTAQYENEADLIAVLNYHRIRDGSGNIVQPREVIKWTVENSRLPAFGLISDWSADGLVMSYGNSGMETGVFVGMRGARILDGTDAGTMPIVDPREYETTFNTTTIERENIYVPRDELEKASELFK